ncbi:MAG: hypothetical protein HKN21_15220, partial [Candidatus Eisenbacteria bacterium]|nr:hypothetical protein [Candidatus Eisenbacteria bacterium]
MRLKPFFVGWFLLLVCGTVSLASAQTPVAEGPVVSRVDTLSIFPGENVKCLQRSRVFPSSLRVQEADSLLVNGQDFLLDSNAGCLTLIRVTALPRELVVSYQALRIDLEPRYRLLENPHRRQTGVSVETPEAETDLGFTSSSDVSGLEISGSKTFGIELGNRQDLKLRQSLDLRLFGNLNPDTKLLAILSDQDLPFQPEGNTTELAELDKVLLELQTPK